MAYYVLSDKAKVVARSTVASMSQGDNTSQELKDRKATYTSSVEEFIGNHTMLTINHSDENINHEEVYETLFDHDDLDDEEVEPQEVNELGNPLDIPDVDC